MITRKGPKFAKCSSVQLSLKL
uniref:BRCA2B n=1 Tax=Arundo donax TaxID=35708 RepID=A0A0A9EEX9_ARUDO